MGSEVDMQSLLKWLKRGVIFAIAYAVLFGAVLGWQMLSHRLASDPDADLLDKSAQDTKDRLSDNAAIIESVREFVTLNRQPQYQRDAHAKGHGCVRATFEVFATKKYNYGIFAKPATHEAWIRFSNGSVPTLNDPKKDARGMAVKVMGVPGKQLLPPLLAGQTQDFVMITSPRFFIRKISGYKDLEKRTTEGKPFTYFLGDYYLNPFKWNLRELYLGLSTRQKPPATPLSTQYYSASPYQLGPHEIKYSAKACENYQAPGVDRSTPNFLRQAMQKVLQTQDACFQFMVQIRDQDARMPIQDTTVIWSEKKAPFVPVARIHIPQQEFDTPQQNALCEALSFNVWHGTKEMRPLSYFNELRRDLYLHTSAYRNVRNGAAIGEPKSWCDSLPEYCSAGKSTAASGAAAPGAAASDSLTPIGSAQAADSVLTPAPTETSGGQSVAEQAPLAEAGDTENSED